MEGQLKETRNLDASSQGLTETDQTTANLQPNPRTKTSAPDAQTSDLMITTSEPSRVPKTKENIPPESNEEASSRKMSTQGQQYSARSSPKAGAKRGTHNPEAIRRGLSFGPIKKPGQTQSPPRGTLKATSRSPPPKPKQRSRSSSSEDPDSGEVGRLGKDKYADDADEEGAVESSDEDNQAWSSEDETSPSRRARGRKRADSEQSATSVLAEGDKPAVMVTAPDGEKPVSTSKRFITPVHPNTNFDHRSLSKTPSRNASPNTTDSEEMDDIRRAQQLSIHTSNVDSTVPHHVIQTIIRGGFYRMQEEANEGIRRLRKYLVATDLSEEAKYALEWTIGTILRDGDTLYAIYAVNEETGTGKAGDSLPVGEGGKAIQDTTAVMEKATAASKKGSLMSMPSSLAKATKFRSPSRSTSAARSPDFQAQVRLHALDTLRRICLEFIRRTKLQVRMVIEVIHCKSPRSMITEAVSRPRQSTEILRC